MIYDDYRWNDRCVVLRYRNQWSPLSSFCNIEFNTNDVSYVQGS